MPKERLISLDAFRGLTVAAMVLVNNPASRSFVYAPLRHAPWHGWTPTDLDAQERALEVGRCGKRLQNAFLTLFDGGQKAPEFRLTSYRQF
jgi:hypothetical protein